MRSEFHSPQPSVFLQQLLNGNKTVFSDHQPAIEILHLYHLRSDLDLSLIWLLCPPFLLTLHLRVAWCHMGRCGSVTSKMMDSSVNFTNKHRFCREPRDIIEMQSQSLRFLFKTVIIIIFYNKNYDHNLRISHIWFNCWPTTLFVHSYGSHKVRLRKGK